MELVLVRREVTEERMEGGSEAGLAWWREVKSAVEGQEGTWITLVPWSHPDRRPRFL